MYNNEDKDKPKTKGGLDRAAFKHAIGFIESRNGKYLDSKHSSAAGRYHFLYNLIKGDPLLKGVSKRDFINDTELQEQIMDKAIDGKLKGYVGYARHAQNLKSEFNTNLSVTEVAALTHFLGAGGARKYLRDPQGYKVKGVNSTPEKYVEIFRNQSNEYYKKNPKNTKAGKAVGSGITYTDDVIQAMQVPKDGVNIVQPQIKDIPNGLEFKQNTYTDTSFLPDAVSDVNDDAVNDAVIPINEQVQGGTPSNLKVLEDTSSFSQGGSTGGSNEPMVVEFNEGGSHDENPHGGIPIGMGSNGKINTVEEGETKFGDYVFSDRISLDGFRLDAPNKSNQFAEGGDVDPKEKKKASDDESQKAKFKPTKIEKTFTNLNDASKKQTQDYAIPRYSQMPNFKEDMSHLIDINQDGFSKERKDMTSWYSDPATLEKAKKLGVTKDVMMDALAKGINGPIEETEHFNQNANAQYFPDSETIKTRVANDESITRHEMGHRAGFDALLSNPLVDIMGNAFHQEEEGKGNSSQFKRYLNQPHEMYENFHELRIKLGLKPGEKLTQKQLEKKIKEKGLEHNDFYKTFDSSKIIEAIDKVASNGKPKQQQEYRLA